MQDKLEKLKSAVGLLRLLSHPVRLSILCHLLQHREMSVTEIVDAQAGAASQSQISQFLSKMRHEGLVKTRKQAQIVYYKIHSDHAKKVVHALYGIYCKKSR